MTPLQDPNPNERLAHELEDVQAVLYVMRRHAGPDEPMVFMSPTAETVFGWDREALMYSRSERARRLHPDDHDRWEAAAQEAEHTGVWDEEYRIVDRDGRTRWIHDRAFLLPSLDEGAELWLGWALDITASRQARRALLDSERRHRSLVEQAPAVIFTLSNEVRARLLYQSPQVEDLLGYPVAEWLDHDDYLWERVTHPADRERVTALWIHSVETGEPFAVEYRLLHAEGHVVWVSEVCNPVRDEDGAVRFWQGVSHDITARKQAEDDVRRSEARYRALVERLPVLVYVDSDEPEPLSLYVSPNVEEILGYPPAQYLREDDLWPRSIHPDDQSAVAEAWRTAVAERSAFRAEYRMVRPDGLVVWMRDQSKPVYDEDGTVLFWQGVMEDVTERRRAEDELRASQERYRALVEQLPAVVYHYSESGVSDYVSPNVEQLLGRPAEAFVADHTLWHRILHPDDEEVVRRTWSEAEREGSGYEVECRYARPDGSVVWVRDAARMVRGPDDDDPAWQGVLVDITAQKLAEQEQVAAERRYRALVEQVPAVVYEMGPDDERRTLFVSPHAEELLGYGRQEWLDQPDIWIELLHPEDREIELDAHDRHNESGKPWNREYRLIANDGSVVWVRDRAKLVRDPVTGDATWLGIMLDITESKELEERLQLMNDELEHRVRERTAELAEANELMGLEIGERRRAERELRDAREEYRTLVEHLPAAVYTEEVNRPPSPGDPHPPDLVPYISPQITSIFGYSPSEWQRPDFWKERVHPHDRAWVLELAERTRATGEPFIAEHRYLAKDGSVVWVLEQATMRERGDDGTPRIWQGVILDITGRKEAERKAAEAELRYRTLAEGGPVISYVLELDRSQTPASWRIEYVSPQVAELLGTEGPGWQGSTGRWLEMVHPDDRAPRESLTASVFESGKAWSTDYRMIASDGRVIWVHDAGRTIERDEIGRPTRFQGVVIDITERKEEELRLRSTVERQSALLEGLPGVPWTSTMDPETGIEALTFIGPQCEDVVGYTPEEILAEVAHFERLIHPEDRERVLAANRLADRTGVWDETYRVVARDGSVKAIRSVGRRVTLPEGTGPVQWQGIALPADPAAVAAAVREAAGVNPSMPPG